MGSTSAVTVSDSAWAYFCASFSPPPIPATISPDIPSLLIRSAAAAGGDVHDDTTLTTCGLSLRRARMSRPVCRAAALSAPPVAVTVNISCISLWENFSASRCDARADSEVGSWKPPEDRLFATGTPNTAAPIITRTARVMTRFGAPIASNAIRCSTARPPNSPLPGGHSLAVITTGQLPEGGLHIAQVP